ncbi:hypothetical protein AOB60_15525 [Streptomyces noursei]|uniref:PRC-barrel domain-containing protein n=1 Tax=Streptomyces noursei TaxID=1971 RepID=A0A2N8PLV2_STRNR|nr:hypothetical protein AOB60_15525 [Streptomyces noursei]
MITSADIGKPVVDDVGRVGVLVDVIADYEDPSMPTSERRKRPTAFIRPERGGREWLASPVEVNRV